MATTWTSVTDIISGLEGGPMDPERKRLPDIVNGVKVGAALAKD
jgi:hypothetical protein